MIQISVAGPIRSFKTSTAYYLSFCASLKNKTLLLSFDTLSDFQEEIKLKKKQVANIKQGAISQISSNLYCLIYDLNDLINRKKINEFLSYYKQIQDQFKCLVIDHNNLFNQLNIELLKLTKAIVIPFFNTTNIESYYLDLFNYLAKNTPLDNILIKLLPIIKNQQLKNLTNLRKTLPKSFLKTSILLNQSLYEQYQNAFLEVTQSNE